MVRINEHYRKLKAGYLFPEIGRRVRAYTAAHPDAAIIRMGIGDVTQPLAPAVIAAMHQAVDEMGSKETFRGYDDDGIGYGFLREAIRDNDFRARGAEIAADEIFVSDGSKCDTGNFQELLSLDSVVAVQDPVYQVYVDTNVMAGRTGACGNDGHFAGLAYLPCTVANGFRPALPAERVDVVYLCSPNNPTGAVLTRADLERWVEFARKNDALILCDAAYEAFILNPELPHSIYEIPGATEVAVEFRSFSKTAGFTGTRCAFTVVPKAVTGRTASGERVPLHSLWSRRHCTKFNGVSYPVQRGAAAIYSPDGKQQVKAVVDHYLDNARIIREGLAAAGFTVHGGVDAPYIWLQVPAGYDSWSFFDALLDRAHVVGTPGAGFGPAGEGFFRLSAFGEQPRMKEAVARIQSIKW